MQDTAKESIPRTLNGSAVRLFTSVCITRPRHDQSHAFQHRVCLTVSSKSFPFFQFFLVTKNKAAFPKICPGFKRIFLLMFLNLVKFSFGNRWISDQQSIVFDQRDMHRETEHTTHSHDGIHRWSQASFTAILSQTVLGPTFCAVWSHKTHAVLFGHCYLAIVILRVLSIIAGAQSEVKCRKVKTSVVCKV